MLRYILVLAILLSFIATIGCSGDKDNQAKKTQTTDQTPSDGKAFVADTSRPVATPPVEIAEINKKDLSNQENIVLPDTIKSQLYWPGGIKIREQSIYINYPDTTIWITRRIDAFGQLIREFTVLNYARTGPAYSWRADGTKEADMHLKDGQLEGECLYYDSSGIKDQLVNYKAGVRDGKFENYYPDGSIKKRGYFSNDKLEGEYSAWHNNGEMEYKGQYGNDLMQGEWIKYYRTGEVKAVSNYVDGNRNGPYKVYATDGYLITDDVYENGELLEK